MIVPRYAPGDWYAVVADGRIAVLPRTSPTDLVQALWTSVRDGVDLTAQVQLLLGSGIAAAPPFALVTLEGGKAHVIARGTVRVEVATASGTRVIDASQVSTWAEDIVAAAESVTVLTPDAGTPHLPVLSGVVCAGAVLVELRAGTSGTGDALSDDDAIDELEQTLLKPTAEAVSARTQGEPHAPDAPAPESADAPAEESPTPTPAAGDHDGHPVLSSDVVTLRRQLPAWAGDAIPGPFTVPAPRTPPPAKLLMSSGLVVSLNRPVLIGRAPQVTRVPNREIPRLVTVASPNHDISRTHAEVRQEGEDVVVTDLRSTNGVLLLRQGSRPQRLHPGEPTVVESGVVVDLGDGVSFIVEKGA